MKHYVYKDRKKIKLGYIYYGNLRGISILGTSGIVEPMSEIVKPGCGIMNTHSGYAVTMNIMVSNPANT